jgi:Tfp pilus assembly protein PilO
MKSLGSKLLAILLLLLVVAPLVAGGYNIFSLLRSQPALEAETNDQTLRLEAAAAVEPSSQDAEAAKTFAGRVLLGKAPPAVLSAALQERLRALAQQRGITVVQASELTSDVTPPLNKVGLKLDVTGSSESILQFASEIEQLEPWLAIEAAILRSGFVDTSPQQQEPLMTASLEIWGRASTGADAGGSSQ